MMTFSEGSVDAVVIGAGHAGCEAALALARTGQRTVILTLNPDSIGFMPCNPSIGGTAKGHLVREVDALGGEMGLNADRSTLQIRMLNRGKGAAVQSLRAQVDKNQYHREMKRVFEHTENLRIVQGEAAEILTENGKVVGVQTAYGGIFTCRAVIIATGVYLGARTITGDYIKETSYEPGRVTYEARTENGGVAVFSEIFFPWGWEAAVDGKPVEIGRVDYVLRALNLPAGQNSHTIVFEFRPKRLEATNALGVVAVSLIFLLCAGAIAMVVWRNARDKAKHGDNRAV